MRRTYLASCVERNTPGLPNGKSKQLCNEEGTTESGACTLVGKLPCHHLLDAAKNKRCFAHLPGIDRRTLLLDNRHANCALDGYLMHMRYSAHPTETIIAVAYRGSKDFKLAYRGSKDFKHICKLMSTDSSVQAVACRENISAEGMQDALDVADFIAYYMPKGVHSFMIGSYIYSESHAAKNDVELLPKPYIYIHTLCAKTGSKVSGKHYLKPTTTVEGVRTSGVITSILHHYKCERVMLASRFETIPFYEKVGFRLVKGPGTFDTIRSVVGHKTDECIVRCS